MEASTAAKMLAYTTDAAIEPDWSTHRTTSRRTAVPRRPYPMSRCGTMVRRLGLVVAQVGPDGGVPVDVVVAGPVDPGGPVPAPR